jgi:hypothetical protein
MNYKEKMYSAFQSICKMEIDDSKKNGMLTYLFSVEPNNWRVVGISIDAIMVFKQYNFQRRSKMGINRSHIKRRSDTYNELMIKEKNREFNSYQDWWSFYFDNDKTVLQTSSENMRKNGHSKIIEFHNPNWSLFKSKGYAWNHGEDEIHLLKNLFQKYCNDTHI